MLISAIAALAQHRLLDRLIRGRTWIGIVAFALIGIVTLQLSLLKLNGGIGRALERAAALQRENAALSIENSETAAGLKVETRAGQLGMAFASSGQLRFLGSRPYEDAAQAAAALAAAARAATAHTSEGSGASVAGSPPSSGVESSAGGSAAGEASSGEASSSSSGESAKAQSSESRPAGEAPATEATSAPAHEAPASNPASGEASSSGGGGEAQSSGGAQASPGG